MKCRIEFDIIARFPCNSCGVRVGIARNKRGHASPKRAGQMASRFERINGVETYTRLRLVEEHRHG